MIVASDKRIPIPRPGRGTRLSVNAYGASYSAPSNAQSFPHPWKPSLVSNGLILRRGTVQMPDGVIYTPQINGVPISGDANGIAPVLKLDDTVANDNGESWACIELTLAEQDATSKAAPALAKDQVPIIVHSNAPVSLDPLTARCAVALIVWQGKNAFRAVEGCYFNLIYSRVIPAPGGGPVQHWFT